MHPDIQIDKEIFPAGAKWLRADFHLHTNADREFIYSGDQHQFEIDWIEQLVATGVGVGVVTNHNKFDREEFKRLKRLGARRGVVLHAGVELSIHEGTGCHTLITFNEEWYKNEDYINPFLDMCFAGLAKNRESDNLMCAKDIPGLLTMLDSALGNGRDSFIVFAHVDDTSGICKSVSGSRVGQVITHNFETWTKFVVGLQKVVNDQKWSQWTNRTGISKLAYVEGCDCKSIDEVGRRHGGAGNERATFVKLGSSSFQALKFAMQFHSYRLVRNVQKAHTGAKIVSIEYENGKLSGRALYLNEGLNVVVGKPGSGKSSLMQTLSFALDPKSTLDVTKLAGHKKYKAGTVMNLMGDGGNIKVTYKNSSGELVAFVRAVDGQYFRDDSSGNRVSIDMDESIRVVCFGQKDLTFNVKANIYEQFFLEFIKDSVVEVSEKIDSLLERFETCAKKLKDCYNAPSLLGDARKHLAEVSAELETFRRHKVEDKLSEQNKLQTSKQELAEFRTMIIAELQMLATNINLVVSPSEIPGIEQDSSEAGEGVGSFSLNMMLSWRL